MRIEQAIPRPLLPACVHPPSADARLELANRTRNMLLLIVDRAHLLRQDLDRCNQRREAKAPDDGILYRGFVEIMRFQTEILRPSCNVPVYGTSKPLAKMLSAEIHAFDAFDHSLDTLYECPFATIVAGARAAQR